MRLFSYVVMVVLCVGVSGVSAQDLYRDWNRRVCPVLDTPYRTYRGLTLTHSLAADTGTTGWGDSVSISDLDLWGRLRPFENDFGGELEMRGHLDVRTLEGLEAGSGMDRLHGLMMLRGVAVWHQRYRGGFGLQARAQPGVYMSMSSPDGNVFSVPVGITLIQAFHPDFAIFAGADYYPGFDIGVDPVFGLLYSRPNEWWMQLAYPETLLTWRPYGSRVQFGVGAEVLRWPEYKLGKDDARDRMGIRETQAYLAFSWDTRGFTQIDLRGGYVLGREVRFENGPTIEFEDTPFLSLGFSAML